MLKKLLSVMLIIAMVFSIAPMSAFATPASDFGYSVVDGGASIYSYYESYENPSERVDIPAYIDGYPVVDLSYDLFLHANAVKIISIPKTVKTIGIEALCAPNLEKIEVDRANPVFEIVDGVLINKQSSSIVAYPPKKAGTSYNVPEGIVDICYGAFKNCKNLQSVKLPSTLKKINDGFSDCDNLVKVEIAQNNPYLAIEDNVLFNKDKTELIKSLVKRQGKYTIPYGVKVIKNSAFFAENGIEAVEIPDTVEYIGDGVFSASGIKNIVIPDSVKYLGAAFNYSDIETVKIGNGVKKIEEDTFFRCRKLREVYLGSGVEKLTELVIPPQPERFNFALFETCSSLTDIKVSPDNKVYSDVNGVLASADGKTLYYCPIAKSGDFTIPNGVVKVPGYAFGNNRYIENIYVPDSVKEISFFGHETYTSGRTLKSINVSSNNPNYASIDGVLFNKDKTELLLYPMRKQCADNTYVVPNGVKKISSEIGYYDENYDTINLKKIVLQNGLESIFEYSLLADEIYFNGNYTDLVKIKGINNAGSDNLKYLNLSSNADYEYALDSNGKAIITKVKTAAQDGNCVIPNKVDGHTVVGIGIKAICSGENSIKLPETVSYINPFAFKEPFMINSLNIPRDLKTVDERLFNELSSLENLTVSYWNRNFQVKNGDLLSKDGTELIWIKSSGNSNYTIPDGVKTVRATLHYGINSVTVPASVTNLGKAIESNEAAFKVDPNNTVYADINGSLTNKDKTVLIHTPGIETKSYSIPEGIKEVRDGALNISPIWNEDTYESDPNGFEVNIPASLEKINLKNSYLIVNSYNVAPGSKNFCSVDGVLFSKDMTELIAYPNRGEKAKPEYVIPDGVKIIREGAMESHDYMFYMMNVTVPKSVTKLEGYSLSAANNILYKGSREDWEKIDKTGWCDYGETELAWINIEYLNEPDAPAAALETPQIVSAFSRTQNSVKVTWKSVPGADGYKLYRSENPNDGFKCVKTIKDSKATYYTNGGLTEGKTYYYKVQAYKVGADGKWVYSDLSKSDFMPAAVVFNNVYSNSTYRIRSLWNVVGGADGYQLWRADSPDGEYKIVKTINAGDVDAYSNTGLESGKNYSYKMRAYYTKPTGEKIFGAFSDVQTVAVMPKTPAVTVYSNGVQSARIKWNSISGAAGYQIWRADASGNYSLVKSVTDPTATGYTNRGLKSGEEYTYKVRAYTEVNGKKTFGAYSSPVKVTVK